MIVQAAVSGLGAALIPTAMVEEELASGKLVVSPGTLLSSETYYLLVPEGKLKTGILAEFIQWIGVEAARSSRRHLQLAPKSSVRASEC